MNRVALGLIGACLCFPAAAREESIREMSARFRIFCNQQPREVQATCHRDARDRVALEQARRDADREYQRKQRGR